MRPSPRIGRLLRNRFIVITMKGLKLVERLFHAPRISPKIARTYQMLLKLTWTGGRLRADLASRLWRREILADALENRYIQVTQKTDGVPLEVRYKISEMINRSRGEFYV